MADKLVEQDVTAQQDPSFLQKLANLAKDPRIASGATQFLGGVASREENQNNLDTANINTAEQEAMRNRYLDMANIKPEDLQVALAKYSSLQGPQANLEQSVDLGPSAYQDAQMDPRLKQNLLNQIETFNRLGASGMTPEMAAAANQLRRDTQAQAASQMESIQQSADARGMGGAGLAQALKAQAAQSAANRAAQQSADMQATAYRNQLNAMSQGLGASQQLATTDLNAALQKAQGLDTMSRAQGTLRADTQARNVAAQNAAALADWKNRQAQANLGTEAQHQQEIINKFKAPEQAANIKAAALGGAAKAQDQAAAARTAQGVAKGAMESGLTNTLANAVGNVLGGGSGEGSTLANVGNFLSSLF